MLLPSDFISLIQKSLGADTPSLLAALNGSPVTSLRLNSRKPIEYNEEEVPWCPLGRYLTTRPRFTDDPHLHSGCYYVQEASSMFLNTILTQFIPRNAHVLDACAAPGGKSTLIADYLNYEGVLVSNEFVPKRANILVENLTKWGYPNTIITNNSLDQFTKLGEVFDCAIVDAPCSGEGMFRKDETAINDWSINNVHNCVTRQQEILSSVWQTIKPNGILIYSTCTFNHLEDEDNVDWIVNELGGELCDVNINSEWGIVHTNGYHFYPHKIRGEGFFIAVIRKTNGTGKSFNAKNIIAKIKETPSWLKTPENYQIVEYKTKRWALRNHLLPLAESMLKARLNILSMGIEYAELKGRDWLPAPGLALSTDLNQSSFPTANLPLDTALRYLRTEAITLDNQPKGYVLVKYDNHPLGWVKNIGNRSNNLYPQYWRIRY